MLYLNSVDLIDCALRSHKHKSAPFRSNIRILHQIGLINSSTDGLTAYRLDIYNGLRTAPDWSPSHQQIHRRLNCISVGHSQRTAGGISSESSFAQILLGLYLQLCLNLPCRCRCRAPSLRCTLTSRSTLCPLYTAMAIESHACLGTTSRFLRNDACCPAGAC